MCVWVFKIVIVYNVSLVIMFTVEDYTYTSSTVEMCVNVVFVKLFVVLSSSISLTHVREWCFIRTIIIIFISLWTSQAIVYQMNLGTVSEVTKHVLCRYHLELIRTKLNWWVICVHLHHLGGDTVAVQPARGAASCPGGSQGSAQGHRLHGPAAGRHCRRLHHQAGRLGVYRHCALHSVDVVGGGGGGGVISGYIYRNLYKLLIYIFGAGIAQWLERRTRDGKVAGLNPCKSGGRIFFSRVNFLCWLLFRYPFHPRVTTVARKRSRSFCQSAGGRLQLNTHTSDVCGFAWGDMVHGCMVYTELAPKQLQFHVAPAIPAL